MHYLSLASPEVIPMDFSWAAQSWEEGSPMVHHLAGIGRDLAFLRTRRAREGVSSGRNANLRCPLSCTAATHALHQRLMLGRCLSISCWRINGLITLWDCLPTFLLFISTRTRRLFVLLYWPLSERAKNHDRFVLIGVCWQYGRSDFTRPPPPHQRSMLGECLFIDCWRITSLITLWDCLPSCMLFISARCLASAGRLIAGRSMA